MFNSSKISPLPSHSISHLISLPISIPIPALSLAVALLLPLSFGSQAAAQSQELAGWKPRPIGGGATYTAVSSPDPQHVFMGGTQISLDGFKLVSNPQLYRSSNSGQSFARLNLPKIEPENALTPLLLNDVFFLNPDLGWVGIGKHVLRTSSGGNRQEDWESASLGSEIESLHFFSESIGIAAGENGTIFRSEDGGLTWSEVDSPASSDLFKQFWQGECHGWMVGQKSCEIAGSGAEPGSTPEKKPCSPEMLYSNDAGESWTQLPAFPKDLQVGGIDQVFFLNDGKTGFVAAQSDADDIDSRRALLLKTKDGGHSFEKVELPQNFGKIVIDTGFFGKTEQPIHPSNIQAMYWENEKLGHLAGRAFMNKQQSSDSQSGSSGEKITWLLIDLRTSDGGKTWNYNNRGEFQGSLMNMPSGDGDVGPGLLRDLETGWMPGDSNRIWAHLSECSENKDCSLGYVCSEGGHCHRPDSNFDCSAGDGGASGDGDGKGGAGSGFWGDEGEDSDSDSDAEAGGCDCSSAPIAASGWVLGLLALWQRRKGLRRISP